MNKINLLPSEVVNQIAAGEVVERPSHLVKEIVENALDAGATQIEIEFDQGGRRVRVTDNGSGLTPADLPLALARHATSKIAAADDIWKLHTFGFRGEALASIAAVSRLKILSRTEGAESAYNLKAEFGQVGLLEAAAGNLGTTVLIEDLFENVPARLKFLKSETAESTQIKNILKALALIHPHVEFRLKTQGKVIQVWPKATDFLARVSQVLEIKNLFENKITLGENSAHVVFASPHEVSGQARSIWTFVQDRWVQDRSLQAAVMEAYRGLLMHGEYPIAAVSLRVPAADVDVNIHPTKSAVKFRDPQNAFRAVHHATREGLERAPWLVTDLQPIHTPSHSKASSNIQNSVASFSQTYEAERLSPSAGLDEALSRTQFAKRADFVARAHVPPSYSQQQPQPSSPLHSATGGFWSSLQVIGQAHLTYIVTQSSDKLILVDQHAAHERVAYERLMRGWKEGSIEVQNYLLPLSLDLGADLIEALLSLQSDLNKMGISIDQRGPDSIVVRAAPAFLSEQALTHSLSKLAHSILEEGGGFAVEKQVAELFASMACHSVVRAGQAMSFAEMQSLLLQMDEFPLSSFCPHGRPVSVEYPFYKLEKDFGRI
jgi:DNA mismatch repair protein MutL